MPDPSILMCPKESRVGLPRVVASMERIPRIVDWLSAHLPSATHVLARLIMFQGVFDRVLTVFTRQFMRRRLSHRQLRRAVRGERPGSPGSPRTRTTRFGAFGGDDAAA